MSFGLRVWDAQGRVTLDNVDNTGRLFAKVSIPSMTTTSPVTVSVPGLDPDRIAYSASGALSMSFRVQLSPGQVRMWLAYSGMDQSPGTLYLIYIR